MVCLTGRSKRESSHYVPQSGMASSCRKGGVREGWQGFTMAGKGTSVVSGQKCYIPKSVYLREFKDQ